jgi:hypothetical protein
MTVADDLAKLRSDWDAHVVAIQSANTDLVKSSAASISADLNQMTADLAAIVPTTTAPTAVSPPAMPSGQFSTSQTATVGFVGLLLGLGGGYLLWCSPRKKNPHRRKHRAKEETEE